MGFPLAKTYLAAMLWLGKNTPAEIARARVEAEPLLEENFVEANPKEKVQSVISKMREQAIEPVLEFKPLDLTRR